MRYTIESEVRYEIKLAFKGKNKDQNFNPKKYIFKTKKTLLQACKKLKKVNNHTSFLIKKIQYGEVI